MATEGKNLSEYSPTLLPKVHAFKVGICVSEWNSVITDAMFEGCLEVLSHRLDSQYIKIVRVPGSYELALGAQWLFEHESVDAVVCIGNVIRGETAHFDYVCQATSRGIMEVGLKFSKPCLFCVLTDDNIQQSKDRSGGKHGNKGTEAGVSLLKMMALKQMLSSDD